MRDSIRFSRHIERCNRHDPGDFLPFVVDGQLLGRFRHRVAERLLDWPEVFVRHPAGVGLAPGLVDYRTRSAAVAEVLRGLVESGEHDYLLGEPYPVTPGAREEALFEIDRSAASLFGLRTFGQHVNGLVAQHGALFMWVARRSRQRKSFPGMLDQLVAGGLPKGLSLEENLRKECWEEAGIGPELAARARPVGALSYNVDTTKGYKYDILYCYDLLLPPDFQPVCTDGEVEAFELLPVAEVMARVLERDDFKPNCNLVVIDFLLRHGLIGPRHGEYLELVTGLHPVMHCPAGIRE